MSDNTAVSIAAMLTEAYADKVEMLIPESYRLYKAIRFETGTRQPGNLYHQPVALSRECGISANNDGTAYSLSDPGPVAADYADAQIRGSELTLPTNVAIGAASRAQGGVKQFIESVKFYFKQNADGMAHNIELSLLYGQTSLAATTEVTASGTTGTFVISAATWAPGMWFGMKNTRIDLFTLIGDAAPINTNAAVVVTAIDVSTRTISFSCNASDTSALNSATTSFVFRRGMNSGSNAFKEAAGLDKIITNTGTLFNISAATYAPWKGASYSCGSASLTMYKTLAGLSLCVNAGLDEDVLMVLSPKTWIDVMADLSALRMFDSSYSPQTLKNGAKGIQFYGMNGVIEFMPHIYCKEGEAFAFPLPRAKRIGSTDVTYNIPTMSEKMLFVLESSNGFQFRSYTDQALFIDTPARCVKFTDIVNTG